jgi:hypothetical protein
MAKLSTAAWVAHELGLATSLGSLLFGKLALNPNLEVLENKPERGKEVNNLVRAKDALLATAAVTGLASIVSGVSLSPGSRWGGSDRFGSQPCPRDV